MDYITEAFMGKTPTLQEAEKVLGELSELIKNKPMADYTNHQLNVKLCALLSKQFGFKHTYIRWYRSSEITTNVYTLFSIDASFTGSDYIECHKNRGYYDSKHKHTCYIRASVTLLSKLNLTPNELMSILIHEIGHNFDYSGYMFFNVIVSLLYTIITNNLIPPIKMTNPGKNLTATLAMGIDKIVDVFKFTKYIAQFFKDAYSLLFRIVESLIAIPTFLSTPMQVLLSPLTHLLTTPKRKIEQFADSFAAMYGYGPSLASAFIKLDNANLNKNPKILLTKINKDFLLMNRYITSVLLGAGYGSNDTRIYSNLTYLRNEIKSTDYPKELKAELLENVNKIEEIYNYYIDGDDEHKNIFTLFVRQMVSDIFKRRSDYIAKFFPDNLASFDESTDDIIKLEPYSDIINEGVLNLRKYNNKMNINTEKYSDIEMAFSSLKSNENDSYAPHKIEDALHGLVGKSFTVTIISPTSKNQSCNIMSIYPEESTIDAIVNAIVSNQSDMILSKLWEETNLWHIEIDKRILSRDMNLTEKELTALLLHEVGHMIYSNSVPQRFSKILKFEYAKTNMVSKEILKDNFFRKLLYIPIIGACGINRYKDSIKIELNADAYAVKSGYKEPLVSAMDKIMIYAGNKINPDDEMKELSGFSIDSIIQLQNRQNKLVRKNIHGLISNITSPFSKKMLESVENGLISSGVGSVTESIKDKFINDKIQKITDNFYTSEAFFNKLKKLKRIDPADIDYIGLEINSIRSNDDKMMIVSYIYSKLDIIDYYIALLDSKNPKYIVPHSRESLVQMRNTLDAYRRQAIERKLPDIQYGINIQFPKGYEG